MKLSEAAQTATVTNQQQSAMVVNTCQIIWHFASHKELSLGIIQMYRNEWPGNPAQFRLSEQIFSSLMLSVNLN